MTIELVQKINGMAIVKNGSYYQVEGRMNCFGDLDEAIQCAKNIYHSSFLQLMTDNDQVEEMFKLGLVRENFTNFSGVTEERWKITGDFHQRGFWISADGKITICAYSYHDNLHTEVELENRKIIFHPEDDFSEVKSINLSDIENILDVKIKRISFTKTTD